MLSYFGPVAGRANKKGCRPGGAPRASSCRKNRKARACMATITDSVSGTADDQGRRARRRCALDDARRETVVRLKARGQKLTSAQDRNLLADETVLARGRRAPRPRTPRRGANASGISSRAASARRRARPLDELAAGGTIDDPGSPAASSAPGAAPEHRPSATRQELACAASKTASERASTRRSRASTRPPNV